MTKYLIYFHQQWVGDHTEEWFASRGPLANAVCDELEAAGLLVAAGGLDENIDAAVTADATSGTIVFTDGPYTEATEFLGGFAAIDVPDDETARMWAGRMAEACGWPQVVRRFQ